MKYRGRVRIEYRDGTVEWYYPAKGIIINFRSGKVRSAKVLGLKGR